MKKIGFALLVAILIPGFSYGQSKNEDIVKLLRVSGTSQLLEQQWEAIIPQFQQMMPQVPSVFWFKAREKANFEDLIYDIVPVYAKHFTHDEIKKLIEFYQSPVGRKFVEASPQLMQDSTAIGQRWGERLGKLIVDELTKEGWL